MTPLFSKPMLALALASALLAACGGGGDPTPVEPPPPPPPAVCVVVQTPGCDISAESAALLTAMRPPTFTAMRWSPMLATIATERAQVIAESGVIVSEWVWPALLAHGGGYYWFFDEGVAKGSTTVAEAMAAWRDSPPDGGWARSWMRDVGVGYYLKDGAVYWAIVVAG